MAQKNEFPGYGATSEYRDDPNSHDYRDDTAGPAFTDTCDEIRNNISRINSGANTINKAMQMIGTERDGVQHRDKIHETSISTNKMVADTTRQIKRLSSKRGLDRPQKMQLERLRNDFQEAVQRFTSFQKKAADQVKKSVKLGGDRPKPQLVDTTGWNDDEEDTTHLVEDEQKRMALQAQEEVIEDDLALIQEREVRIQQLEHDILDVNEIFRDLGALVQEQGEVIDSIENNVEKGYSNVQQGTEQLQKAAVYQKKSRKKMCCLIVIFLVVAAVVTVIIVVAVKA